MMSKRNRDLVEDLPYSEKTKAYIAANLELEKGLTRLISELESAGVADRTLIVIAFHRSPLCFIRIMHAASAHTQEKPIRFLPFLPGTACHN